MLSNNCSFCLHYRICTGLVSLTEVLTPRVAVLEVCGAVGTDKQPCLKHAAILTYIFCYYLHNSVSIKLTSEQSRTVRMFHLRPRCAQTICFVAPQPHCLEFFVFCLYNPRHVLILLYDHLHFTS